MRPPDRHSRAGSEESVLHNIESVTLRIGFFTSFCYTTAVLVQNDDDSILFVGIIK
ncbi:MAG: hypothetical protein M0R68_09845 [Bacteroidetes bacterium]|nr:hypothetical protein [Bacteroidota bacterium]